MKRFFLLFWAMLTANAAASQQFDFPVACALGETCFIQQYFDHDTSESARDYMCQRLSYDGHDGTDIRVADLSVMASGVAVTAAANGVVVGTRDGMDDVAYREDQSSEVSGRECGNGVFLEHDGNLRTKYCHLRKGSILVRTGMKVKRGQQLGYVGHSGKAQFPHLHFEVEKENTSVDPFAPNGAEDCGAGAAGSLWREPVAYQSTGIMSVGFSTGVPTYSDVRAGRVKPVPTDTPAPALVVWMYAFGKIPGDSVQIFLTRPDGQSDNRTWVFDRHQAEYFLAYGKRAPKNGWALGTYRGEIVISRAGQPIDRKEIELVVDH